MVGQGGGTVSQAGAIASRRMRPELLDHLAPADPEAIRSRADLRRLNAWMGNAATVARAIKLTPEVGPPLRIVELGGGDGTFLLDVARHLSGRWHRGNTVLVDRLDLLAPRTQEQFRQLGWTVRNVRADVFEWLREHPASKTDLILCNLFLHHFAPDQLRLLLAACARRSPVFLACEPERSWFALGAARLLWAIGCNRVTRHDAVVSVRAGFRGHELSKLWPDQGGWHLSETRTGWFSHFFCARHNTAASNPKSENEKKPQIPNSKPQRNPNTQIPKSGDRGRPLGLGAWGFFGAWGLGFGFSSRHA